MLKEFESNIIKNHLFNKRDRLLLAISGGVDSVVLAHLLKQAKYGFSLAHCNFKLRGNDSDLDEKFCRKLASELGVEILVKQFDVPKYAREKKVSIQMAARNLRYEFFLDTASKNNFTCVLTAHHANDAIETVLINLIRGTGINGLCGIPEKNAMVVRPLLGFLREDIEAYARKNKLAFRTDKSNLEDKYERNFIRLNIIPALKKLNPSLERTFISNTSRFRQESRLIKQFLSQKAMDIVKPGDGKISLNKAKLKQEKSMETLLHFILNPYGFNETQEKNIAENILYDGLPGKNFASRTHELTIGRDEIVVQKKGKPFDAVEVKSIDDFKKTGFVKMSRVKKFTLPLQNELLLAEKDLKFPMFIRRKQTGDKFQPFGMKGFKLLSDFLKQEKLNNFEKENVRLLVNGNGEIVWVMGFRSDERYRVNKNGKAFIKLGID